MSIFIGCVIFYMLLRLLKKLLADQKAEEAEIKRANLPVEGYRPDVPITNKKQSAKPVLKNKEPISVVYWLHAQPKGNVSAERVTEALEPLAESAVFLWAHRYESFDAAMTPEAYDDLRRRLLAISSPIGSVIDASATRAPITPKAVKTSPLEDVKLFVGYRMEAMQYRARVAQEHDEQTLRLIDDLIEADPRLNGTNVKDSIET